MLHIVNKSPLERPSLEACLRIAEPGSSPASARSRTTGRTIPVPSSAAS